tara:strand:- start:32 stop:406 length:375 start_codon:yes stop_codon:yes gene_type:complete
MKNNTETSSHPILDTRFAKLVIGKSYLGDFVRSICVCIFYGVIILLVTMILSAKYAGTPSYGAFGYVAVLGVMATIPVGIIYFSLLVLGRALRRIKTLSNLLRIMALVWFFIIPLTVLYVLVFN